jgi:CRISPR type I-E-associated protein CasB/Cse2
MGDSIREMAIRRGRFHGTVKDAIDLNERYLKRILASRDYRSLCNRLAFVIRMVHNTLSPVDYERLYSDIVSWDNDVKIRWADAYYTSKGEENVPDTNNG